MDDHRRTPRMVTAEQRGGANLLRLVFGLGTASWLIGKAIAEANEEATYQEGGTSQVVTAKRIVADRVELNKIIRKTPLTRGVQKIMETPGVQVLEEIQTPAGNEYILNDERFQELKQYLRSCGQVEKETKHKLVITD